MAFKIWSVKNLDSLAMAEIIEIYDSKNGVRARYKYYTRDSILYFNNQSIQGNKKKVEVGHQFVVAYDWSNIKNTHLLFRYKTNRTHFKEVFQGKFPSEFMTWKDFFSVEGKL